MELALFLLLTNTIFLAIVFLLRFNKLIGLLVTIYCWVWGITIYLLAIFSPTSIPFMTYKGIVILYGHFLCILLAAVFTFNSYHRLVNIKRIKISSQTLYFACLALATIGIGMVLYTTDVWTFYIQNQLAELRGELFEQKITVNRYYKFIGNFVYPLAIIGPLYFFRKRKNILVLIVVIVLGGLLSFSNGGKGNLLIVAIILMGAIVYLLYQRNYIFSKVLKRTAVIITIAMLGFFYFISLTRIETKEEFSAFDSIVLINEYFSSSIPSFCQWIEINDVAYLDFNIGQTALLREAGSIVGISNPRTIDHQVVNIPHRFNVFTAFADSLSAFGYIGSLIYYLIIGAILGLIDLIPKNDNTIFIFSTFFLFVCYSLFTDIFFYMIGSWICLSFHFLFKIEDPEKKQLIE